MAKKKVFQISDALTEGLEETITAAHNYSGELRVEVIPIKKIEADPENPRDLCLTFQDVFTGINENDENYNKKLEELESLQSISHSIREQGIINPIVVYKFGERYRLVAGERRTLASILAGKLEIQAKILESKPNDLKISLLQWIENVERSDLSLGERLNNLEKIVTTFAAKNNISPHHVTVTQLSNLIGCSKPHAMNYKAVLMADDELKKNIHENKIKNLEKAALIASIESSEIRKNTLAACLSGVTLKKLKILSKQSKSQILKKQSYQHINKRGRKASAINLGITKNTKVAKLIFDSIFNYKELSHFEQHLKNVDWNNYQSISQTFKFLIKKLEEIHV